ncbi:hypothetical protein MLD38_002841 [Melastoma candidum]|uniref:Uncharacterized protein n=1 Tax=Melastoma candidum TaxID=119954 RepID=A0ACB9S3R5_9MYRT|nr:hypothetical protein MLD38_002841 [Melastoma candidum]
MNLLRRLDLLENHHPSSSSALFLAESLALPPLIDDLRDDFFFRGLDLFSFPPQPFPLDIVGSVADLVQVETSPVPFRGSCYRRVHHQRTTIADPSADPFFLSLLDRVSALELKLERALGESAKERERKYKWTAEIEGKHADRKYEWVAEIKPGKEKKGGGRRSLKWVTEVKEKGEGGERRYTWTESYGGIEDKKHKGDKEKDKKKGKKEKGHDSGTRLVEIEEPADHRSLVLRQALARRAEAIRSARGKKKELSPEDAAVMIQMNFRAYLIRRSQVLRALRELAVAKAKLKEIRALFNNFSYRRRLSRDAEERQRFSEKVIVLLLSVEAIEGVDLMVRCSKKAMVNELEVILDVVDPQPAGRSLSMRRRTFDMPDGVVKKEIADGVAQIVRMLDEEEQNDRGGELPIYIGDDRTDKDAFKVLREGKRNCGILVSSILKESSAYYSLRDPSGAPT